MADSFPRQQARTRRFQCGRPRSFTIAGDRVFFIRSAGGSDPVGNLWVHDGSERELVSAAALLADGDLPAEERARRERMREMTSGITAFSVDELGARIAFVVSGIPSVVDVETGMTTELTAPGPAIDPRISPDGTHVAFVSGGGLHVCELATGTTRALCLPAHEEETWGLADFIAAEELDRHRGFWWTPDGRQLIVEQVDISGVDIRWISDPAHPETEPVAHRYPSAGTPNAQIALWVVDLAGVRRRLEWNTAVYPYLASVHGLVAQLLTRDQRRELVMRIDPEAGRLIPLIERTDEAWLDVLPGVPALADGALIDIIADRSTDTYLLVRDDHPLTPPGLQVSGVLDIDGDAITIVGGTEPDEQRVYRVTSQGVEALTPAGRITSAVATGALRVEVTSDPDRAGTRFEIVRGTTRIPITSLAERPLVDPRPHYLRTGADALPTAVLLPTGHVPGSRRLPVIVAPYGGPHHARVVRAASAYASDQWLADQGFAVVVADGRGTPGRGPAWERAIRGDLAGVVVADQVAAVHGAAEAFADLDLERVGIHGWSFGGYLAALAVLDRPDVFHAAVAGAPVTDWRLYDTAYTERYLGHPVADPAAYDATSLIPRAGALQRPLMLIHGLADDNVLAAHTLQLSSALLAAGRTHSVLPLSGVTHMTPQEDVAENLLRAEVEFLARHLQISGPGSSGVSGPAV